MSLVPVAVWTESYNVIRKYPLLIYHEEPSGFDVDSIIYFMQQYDPDELIIVGSAPNELLNLLILLVVVYQYLVYRFPPNN